MDTEQNIIEHIIQNYIQIYVASYAYRYIFIQYIYDVYLIIIKTEAATSSQHLIPR